MRFLSLFSGIGGFDIGLERAGMQCVGQVENNDYCNRVLEKHWPNVKRMKDIYNVTGNEFGTIDLICGGIPCQPASCAGKRRGTQDNRWLWPETFRVVRAIKPAWCLFENVRGILTLEGGLVFENLLSELENIGYEVQTFIIPACAVDAPHRRDRVWIVAHSNGGRCSKQNIRYKQPRRTEIVGTSENVAYTAIKGRGTQRKRVQKPEVTAQRGEDVPNSQSERCREAGEHIIRSEKRSSGNGENVADTKNTDRGRSNKTDYSGRGNQKTGRCGIDGIRIQHWSSESGICRVSNGISTNMDGTIRRINGNTKCDKKAIAKVMAFRRRTLRYLWRSHQITKAPPETGARSVYSCMSKMPQRYSYEGWILGQRIEKEKKLRYLWDRILSSPLKKTQNLQCEMLEQIGKIECSEKMAKNRTRRLRALGNAVVPQIVEIIGKAIMKANENEH